MPLCAQVANQKIKDSRTHRLFRLAKGIALLAVGIGALRFLHHDLAKSLEHWVNAFQIDPENHYVHRVLARALNVTPKQPKEISVGTFIYAGLFLTEGVGLLMRRRWAEYFTTISTGLFIPLEVYELFRHVTALKIVLLVVNIAIVVYLIARLRSERRAG
jgi:uncharacterized membrane protein (DUF2068 family)